MNPRCHAPSLFTTVLLIIGRRGIIQYLPLYLCFPKWLGCSNYYRNCRPFTGQAPQDSFCYAQTLLWEWSEPAQLGDSAAGPVHQPVQGGLHGGGHEAVLLPWEICARNHNPEIPYSAQTVSLSVCMSICSASTHSGGKTSLTGATFVGESRTYAHIFLAKYIYFIV